MNQNFQNRRSFLKSACLSIATFPLLLNCKTNTLAQKTDKDILKLIRKNAMPAGTEGMGAIDAPAKVSWKTTLAKPSDKDIPLLISGTIFQSDGKTPAPNILIYFYHTDSEGIYGRKGEHKHGRFRSWLLTDKKGRYEFRTIKPASYPNTKFASHIHMTLTGKDFKEYFIDSILFEGDRFITARERNRAGKRGGFNPILTLKKDSDDILIGKRDIQLKKKI